MTFLSPLVIVAYEIDDWALKKLSTTYSQEKPVELKDALAIYKSR